jgi:hypothetical protein
MPVKIGATRNTSKSFRKDLTKLPEKHKIKELQKTVISGTAHILRKLRMYNYKRSNIANSTICTMSSNYRMAATLYSLGTWFVSGI